MAGHDRLTPEGQRFFAEIAKLRQLQVRIGFQDDGTMAAERDAEGNVVDSDVTLLDVAMWNELGTVNAPSRPFLRNSVDENEEKISAFCKRQLRLLASGSASAESILKQIGVKQKGLVQEKIRNGEFAENKASTIRRKKSDRPLIDTGRMRQSVNFVVREKEGEKK